MREYTKSLIFQVNIEVLTTGLVICNNPGDETFISSYIDTVVVKTHQTYKGLLFVMQDARFVWVFGAQLNQSKC